MNMALKNQTGGKTVFASDSRFNPILANFDRFLKPCYELIMLSKKLILKR